MPDRETRGFESDTCHHPTLVNLYECDIGEGTRIGVFVEIGKTVKIGKRCKIQSFAYIPEGVTIGDDVFIGPHVCFTNSKHPMTGEEYIKTIVQDGVVIGAGAVILPGVVIGHDAVIGAGSVVTKVVLPGKTVKGNPAK